MHWQRRPSLGISVLFIAFGSCFEAPIREELRLRFLPNGGGAVSSIGYLSHWRAGER